jgi:hypothetical protein
MSKALHVGAISGIKLKCYPVSKGSKTFYCIVISSHCAWVSSVNFLIYYFVKTTEGSGRENRGRGEITIGGSRCEKGSRLTGVMGLVDCQVA